MITAIRSRSATSPLLLGTTIEVLGITFAICGIVAILKWQVQGMRNATIMAFTFSSATFLCDVIYSCKKAKTPFPDLTCYLEEGIKGCLGRTVLVLKEKEGSYLKFPIWSFEEADKVEAGLNSPKGFFFFYFHKDINFENAKLNNISIYVCENGDPRRMKFYDNEDFPKLFSHYKKGLIHYFYRTEANHAGFFNHEDNSFSSTTLTLPKELAQ